MDTSVVTTKGQVVIPKRIRQLFHITIGTPVRFETHEGKLILRPLTPAYFEHMAGLLGAKGKATKALLAERAKDRRREARR